MNYLQLCQRLRQETGVSGSESTVANASGEWKRLCDWVNQAWVEIQQYQPDWDWMVGTKSFNTIANQAEYAPADAPISLTDFSRWKDNSFRIYKSSVGDEHFLDQWDYWDFRDEYLISTQTITYSYPHAITVSPSNSLILALPPDGIYTVTGEYYKAPGELSADADTLGMPSQYHMLVVYSAMRELGYFESAPEIIERGQSRFNELMQRLINDEAPEMTIDRDFE